MLVPPHNHPNVDWSVLPAGAKDLPETEDEFRGYIVEFYNQVSDCSIQDSHQAICNFKALLDTLKSRHARLTSCARETDGATTYNSKSVSVFMEEMGRVTGIRVCSHTHNEPGHGSDQCDSCGANCVRACYAWHIKHGTPIDHARQTVGALQSSAGLKGIISLLMSHDPSEKLDPSMIPDLLLGTRHCLHKRYCYLNGKGSLVQHRFFGIGTGLSSSAEFLKGARCGHTYADKKVTSISDVKHYAAPVRTGQHGQDLSLTFLRRVGCRRPTTYIDGRLTVVRETLSTHTCARTTPSPCKPLARRHHIILNPSKPQVGDNVDANFEGKGIWYGGHITSIDAEGFVGVQYTNGDIELGVPPHCVRAQKFMVGDMVEVNCGGKGVWHAAEVTEAHDDGITYDVRYGSQNAFTKGVLHSTTSDRLHEKAKTVSNRAISKRRRANTEGLDPSKCKKLVVSQRTCPVTDPASKLTKSQAMTQLRETLRHFSTSAVMSVETFKFQVHTTSTNTRPNT